MDARGRKVGPSRAGGRRLLASLAASFVALASLAVSGDGVREVAADSANAPSKRAWLGVELERGPAGGVLAKHVVTNSPAGRAGIADGDQLIAADGVLLDEPKQLVARVAITGPNGALSIRVRHGGVERDVTATLVPHP